MGEVIDSRKSNTEADGVDRSREDAVCSRAAEVVVLPTDANVAKYVNNIWGAATNGALDSLPAEHAPELLQCINQQLGVLYGFNNPNELPPRAIIGTLEIISRLGLLLSDIADYDHIVACLSTAERFFAWKRDAGEMYAVYESYEKLASDLLGELPEVDDTPPPAA